MDSLSPPPRALQSSRVSFHDRSISPATRSTFRHESPSPAGRSPSSNRATSRSRLIRPFSRDGSSGSPSTAAGSGRGGSSGERSTSRARKAENDFKVNKDVRTRLPPFLRRFTGYRPPHEKPPHQPLPFPPFSWLKHIPLQYETWLLSTIGSFGGIALIEVIISAAFPNDGTILIVASFGASAVLSFGTIESPLAQPRHLVGGQVLSCILAVALTRLFQKTSGYDLTNTIVPGELDHIVWINGALAMALSLLLMQITGTVHPPGGATAIIAAVQPAAVAMSWRLIYVVLISSLIMLVWALIINNVGRRRYPHYWFSGTKVFVAQPSGDQKLETIDEAEMAAEEGRTEFGFRNLEQVPEGEEPYENGTEMSQVVAQDEERRGRPTGLAQGRSRFDVKGANGNGGVGKP